MKENEVAKQHEISDLFHSFSNEEIQSLKENQEKQEAKTLDKYLDKIGYTRFHLSMIAIVCFIFFVDGCEMIITNLSLSTLQKEWKLSNNEKSLLSSAVFFGFFTGSFISGYFTNKYGRKYPTISGSLIIWVFTSLVPHTNQFLQLFLLRICVGIGIGIVVPSATSLVTESIPSYCRSFVLNMLWVLYPVGIIYICYISMHYIEGQNLDWRKIAFLNSVASVFMIFMTCALPESPRYLLFKHEYERAFDILNEIGTSQGVVLSEADKNNIIFETKLMEAANSSLQGNFNLRGFVEGHFLRISILVAFLWFISSFISYGLLYILPKIFDGIYKQDKLESIKHMMHAMIILFFCPIFRGIISEIKWLGRKNAMIIGFAGSMAAGIVCTVNQSNLSLFSGLLKFFINTSLGIVSVYTSEIYPTSLRSIALGFGNAITRLGGIVTPFICEYTSNLFPNATFYLFAVSSISGVIACLLLPYETMGMALDSIDKRELGNEDSIKIESKKLRGVT